jgi:molybdenum cofactor cytidylyltransferase
VRPAAVVLAAGAGSRFGDRPGAKLLALIGGQPMLLRVLATLREYGPASTVVVLGHGADELEAALEWAGELRVRNPDPERGLSSSLRIGFDALGRLPAAVEEAFVVLGDQPHLRVATLRALEQAAVAPGAADRALIVPAYADDPGPRNPVLVRRVAWPLIGELSGDRGLGTIIAERPELSLEVRVAGTMPDVDTREDLELADRPSAS